MRELLQAARNVSVPLVIMRTADQVATLATVIDVAGAWPVLQWDAVRGLVPANKLGEAAVKKIEGLGVVLTETPDFKTAMAAVALTEKGTITYAHNAHRQLQSSEPGATAGEVQAVANLRDRLKGNFRMLILAGPHFAAPPELEQDVVVLEDILPGPEPLARMVRAIYDAARKTCATVPVPTAESLAKAVDALSGLSLFAAEQVASMSMTPDGLDMVALWERKRVTIEQTDGLGVYRGTETFKDIIGCANAKDRLARRLKAKTPVGCVVFIDEIDKVLANVEHDTSGVRMDQLRTLLTEMEDNRWPGVVFVGVPGAGKSALAKAFGNEAGVPTISLDLGAMEGSLVGQSEARLRQAVAVIKAVGRGHAFFIATSNNASVMRPELQRRFTKGTFFFDVMSAEERAAVWKYYVEKFDLGNQPLPDDDGWTGAEIRNACEEAWDTGVTLVEAARHVVAMAMSRGDEIEKLRQYAHGRFLDANRPGPYQYSKAPMETMLRGIQFDPPDAAGLVRDLVTLTKKES